MDSKFVRFDPNNHDPTRQCQGSGQHGQCPYLADLETNYCPRHGGNNNLNKKKVDNYLLTKWQARVKEKANSDEVKSLRDEVGILRMTLEMVINACNDEHDLVLQSSKIGELVMKIDRVINSCHRLDKSTGALLDKSSLIALATMIIQIIANHVTDEDVFEVIAFEILEAIRKMRPADEQATGGSLS